MAQEGGVDLDLVPWPIHYQIKWVSWRIAISKRPCYQGQESSARLHGWGWKKHAARVLDRYTRLTRSPEWTIMHLTIL